MIKKTYIGDLIINLTPAASALSPIWHISLPARQFNLKSIFWTYNIFNVTGSLYVPVENNGVIQSQLHIYPESGMMGSVGYAFKPGIAPNPSLIDTSLALMKTGQYFFNDLFFQNDLIFLQSYISIDMVNSYNLHINLTSEIEEI